MTARDRIAIGGLGGAAPVLLNLLVVDAASSLVGLTVIVAISYAVKVFALMAAGSIAAWLHEDEVKAAKVFQLGMVAPALLTGMMNGAALRVDTDRHQGPSIASWSLVTPLHAAQSAESIVVQKESIGQQIVRGAFGIKNDPHDWVIQAAATPDEYQARSLYARLARSFPSLKFTLFRPSGGIETWLVTVGGQMTQQDALAARDTLKPESGLVATLRQLPDERMAAAKK